MKWRDFFYFSKGERRALIVLLSLIAVAWLILVITGEYNHLTGGRKRAADLFYPVCLYPLPPSSPAVEAPPADILSPPANVKTIEEAPSTRTPFYRKTPDRVEKYPKGTLVELNTADTVSLKKIPGIGSAFSNRIVKYRNLLGGYHSVDQLSEVYGMDEERFAALKEWFCVNPGLIQKRPINRFPTDSLLRHPYLNYRQAKAIQQLRRQKGKLTGWENLILLEEFSEADRKRIEPYLSFE